jgi:hypothetical protein
MFVGFHQHVALIISLFYWQFTRTIYTNYLKIFTIIIAERDKA